MYYEEYKGKYGLTRFDGLEFYSKKQMIHHRMEKYNPVIWTGRKRLGTAREGVSGQYVFVFQPEKRQQDVRKTCQEQQVVFGARVKHAGVSHADYITGKTSDDKQTQLSELMKRIQLTAVKSESTMASEGFRQEELVSQPVATSASSQQWQTSQSWWSGWEWTAGQERWWEQTEWAQQPEAQDWQEPTAESSAQAKKKAKSETSKTESHARSSRH